MNVSKYTGTITYVLLSFIKATQCDLILFFRNYCVLYKWIINKWNKSHIQNWFSGRKWSTLPLEQYRPLSFHFKIMFLIQCSKNACLELQILLLICFWKTNRLIFSVERTCCFVLTCNVYLAVKVECTVVEQWFRHVATLAPTVAPRLILENPLAVLARVKVEWVCSS